MNDTTFDWLLKAEGGYVNNPNDPGGETNMGVTKATFNRAKKDGLVKSANVRSLTKNEVRAIFEKYYYIPCKAGLLPEPVATIYFDMAINSGPSAAMRTLHRAMAAISEPVAETGIGGPTVTAIHKIQTENRVPILALSLMNRRKEFYDSIIQKNQKLATFRKGWMNRLTRLAVHCKISWP